MRVLHVLPTLSLKQGGPTQAALNFVRNLQKNGVDAEIATTNDDGERVLDIPLHQRIDYHNAPVQFFPRMARMKEFLPSRSLTQWLWTHSQNYDVIHTHYLFSYAPTMAMGIARQKRIPYIARTIGQLTPWALAQGRLKKQVYSTLIERHNLNHAAAVHCTATGEATDVEQFGVNASKFILPLGVNAIPPTSGSAHQLRDRYKVPADVPIILFLSRLHYKKRPDLLIQAVRELVNYKQSCHLILAGTGEAEYIKELQELVESCKLTAHISFAGFVSGSDKDLLLQGADIFALPSFSENFGIAIAEAMAAGLPVVVTPGIQISPEIKQAKAGLVIDDNVESLTHGLSTLISNPELRAKLGNNGQTLVAERYSWRAIAQQLTDVYTTIIENKFLPHDMAF